MRPADLVVRGRIATLAGDAGLGWVEGLAIEAGRVVEAGGWPTVRERVGRRTRRIDLSADRVAIPGLTDAHLHLVEAALAARRAELAAAPSLDAGLAILADAASRLPGPEAWLLGHGWAADRWGGWPTAADLDRIAPGRRAFLWAHDHHAAWVSEAALDAAGIEASTPDPPGGTIRRLGDGRPAGVLHEHATRLVAAIVPQAGIAEIEDALLALVPVLHGFGLVAAHDPAESIADPDLDRSFPAYRRLDGAGRLAFRVFACVREPALETAIAAGYRSGQPLASNGHGRARVGWLKLFADGTLGSRTAALLTRYEADPAAGPPPAGPSGTLLVDAADIRAIAESAATAGIATQVHAIGDRAVRAALDGLAPTVGRTSLVPRVEHVQLADPADLGRFAALGIAASVQPIHLRSDVAQARRAWGERVERGGYRWASIARTGALLPFGTDAPVEPVDPWPGISLAVTRRDPQWPDAEPAFGAGERLSLERALRAACVDPPRSAGETDRGRLVPGSWADLAVVPAAAFDEPAHPGGPLGEVHAELVLLEGEVVFER